jgi:peptidase E
MNRVIRLAESVMMVREKTGFSMTQEKVAMTSPKGKLVLMGSGELTSTMVEVHKQMLERQGSTPKSVFLDTPAGFQLNVDEISRNAEQYFRRHVQHPLSIVSFKSAETASGFEIETTYRQLRNADYFLIGPGSPSYTVSQLQQTNIPDIIIKRIESGACLTAASAAALTVGRYTLPVYEIYKVGQNLHWLDGLDILSHFGLNLVVIPHWNNAEGGTHDTRFCYMGRPRFEKLEALLPEDTLFVGLDEHTACIMDLGTQTAEIRGLGKIIIRQARRELSFGKGESFSLQLFKEGLTEATRVTDTPNNPDNENNENYFWKKIHQIESDFQGGLAARDAKKMIGALLDLDSTLWKARSSLESEDNITQAREVLRELIVLSGVEMADRPDNSKFVIEPLVSRLLELRADYRKEKKWSDADRIRDILYQSNIIVEDTKNGQKWRMIETY